MGEKKHLRMGILSITPWLMCHPGHPDINPVLSFLFYVPTTHYPCTHISAYLVWCIQYVSIIDAASCGPNTTYTNDTRCALVQDYDDQDVDTETYPVNVIERHPLIECGGGGIGGGVNDEETERTTLLGQSMMGQRQGKCVFLFLWLWICVYVQIYP